MFVIKTRSVLVMGLLGVLGALAALAPGVGGSPELSSSGIRGAAVAKARPQPAAELEQVAAEHASPYLERELMVAARDGQRLEEIVADHGATLRRPVGRSGYGAVRVPEGQDAGALRQALLSDPRVRSADRAGRIEGAKSKKVALDRIGATALTWHLDAMDAPTLSVGAVSDTVIAVLDTGVAYESYRVGGVRYRVAPSLAFSSFVAPYDFVNGDVHANDDNQHGTHIASLIASAGTYTGVVPGATIMPVKVLDARSSGSEVDLVDALYYAADHGADIINLSLCFSEGYVPSAALQDALQYAYDQDVVMIAAAGNDGSGLAHYPAASPLVISVGATTRAAGGGLQVADYSNTGATLDVMAPGGDLAADRDGDGVVDGVVAESFDPGSPGTFGAWMFSGTSQAAALATGAAALAMDAGVTDPEGVALALQAGAGAGFGAVTLNEGLGAGSLSAEGAMAAVASVDALRPEGPVSVAALPFLASLDGGARVAPAVKLSALDGAGDPLPNVELLVTFWGSGGEELASCVADSAGVCTATGPEVDARDGAGANLPLAFAFGVDGVVADDAVIYRPGGALFVSDALVVLAAAMQDAGLLDDTLLAWRWDAGREDGLGEVADALMLVDAGAGSTSRPVGVVFTPEALGDGATIETASLDLEATGLISDPLGIRGVSLVTLSGTGLISDPLGLLGSRLLVMSASGLISDPLGFRAIDVYSDTGWTFSAAGLISDPLGFAGLSVSLKSGGSMSGTGLDGTDLGDLLESGGWVTDGGTAGGSALSGAVSSGLSAGRGVATGM